MENKSLQELLKKVIEKGNRKIQPLDDAASRLIRGGASNDFGCTKKNCTKG